MASINISIPQNMKEWVNLQVETGEYSSASDYFRDLVRNHQRTKEYVDQQLLEGLNSGDSITPTNDYWKNKKPACKQNSGKIYHTTTG